MRLLNFKVLVADTPYGVSAVVMDGSSCPTIYLADFVLKYSLWPVDYASAVVPMSEFLELYSINRMLTSEGAASEIYDTAFLEACEEEDEEEYESIEASETGF